MIEATLASVLPVSVFIVVTLVLTAVLVAITVIDLREFRIPDVLSLPLIASGLMFAFVAPEVEAFHHVIGAVAGFALLAGIGEVYFRRNGVEGLGLGDAKLFAAAGAWLDWSSLPIVLLIAAGGGLLQIVLRGKFERQATVAFGPWISIGFWVVWIGTGFISVS